MFVQSVSDMVVEIIPPSMRGKEPCHICGAKISTKYRLKNPTTKETRCYCNMCYLKIMSAILTANKLLQDDFFQIEEK